MRRGAGGVYSSPAETLTGLLEGSFRAHPEAIAVVCGDVRWSYRELERRAEQVAAALAARGLRPEERVALLGRRRPPLIAGMIGVLKAGGAFLPLDPEYPAERLRFMLEDAGAGIVLTDPGWAGGLPGFAGELLPLDPARHGGPAPAPGEGRAVVGAQLAYVIYTSGSTGRPKGVAIEHRSAAELLRWALAELTSDELAGVLAATSICFDLSIFEIFAPLLAGGCVFLADSVLELPRLPGRLRITLVNTVPTAASALLRAAGLPPSVRAVNLAGEPLLRELADRLFAAGVDTVRNLYGPSEDTTYSVAARVDRRSRRPPAIGRPIPGTRAHLLDSSLLPVADGELGELVLAGVGLARCYLGRPALTAERFVPDPFWEAPGDRLYRTGDLARSLASGELGFAGRMDHQVKVRGFRVELGEIEEALARHPAVGEVAVVAVADRELRAAGEGGSVPLGTLAAFAVRREGRAPSPAALRQHLAARLPAYMVPSLYRLLDRLPRTPNGKVDRGELVRLAATLQPPGAEGAAAPRPVEGRLRAIWASVLGVGGVGRDDDLLTDLGGHSLAAARIAARIRDELGVDATPRDVLGARTVAGLGRRIEGLRTPGAEEPAAADGTVPDGGAPEPAGTQAGFVRLGHLDPGQAALNVPVVLPLRARPEAGALDRTLVEILERHGVLRWRFPLEDGRPVIDVAPAPATALAAVDLSALPGSAAPAARRRLQRRLGAAPFDLSRGPLYRFVLITGGEPFLHACFHHAVFDGWSIEVFRRELAAGYRARLAGGTPSSAPPPATFRDFLRWQRARSGLAAAGEDLAYWKRRLAEAPRDHGLPACRGAATRGRIGGRRSLRLAAETENAVRGLAQREGVTLFTVLLTAFAAVLHRYSGRTDLVVGAPTAGRELPAHEGLIGCCIDTVALRLDLAGDPGFRDLLGGVQGRFLEALGHQTLPFDDLVRELLPERGGPLLRILLTMLERPPDDPETDAVVGPPAEPPIPVAGAKLDLTLYAVEVTAGLELWAVYRADLFAGAQVEGLLEHLTTLLEAAASEPATRLSDLPLRPPGHRDDTGAEPPELRHPESVPEGFDRQAAAAPDRVAVELDADHWTYGCLRSWSLAVAGRLIEETGTGPERIAVLFEPDGAMVAALLAVLRIGKAYVPLEPRQPDRRLEAILDDAEVQAVLAPPSLLERARRLARERGLSPVGMAGGSDPPPALARGLPEVPPEAAAYLLYTSGSTGRPKAVVQSQDNLRFHARSYAGRLALGGGDRVTLLSTYGFDAAVMDIFGALLSGATLCPRDVLAGDFPDLARWLAARRITVYHSTPTLFRRLCGALATAAELPHLRWVVLGGEAVERSDAEAFRRLFPAGCRMINGFGPTESTLALQQMLDHSSALPRPVVPIGRPVPGTRVLLANAAGEQHALFGVGEILLKSRRLALGYWRRPGLTAAAFLPDAGGGRTYRTGDLGRLLPGGGIEYAGRNDLQLKIRGYRVEPAEVESFLLADPGVREAAVLPGLDDDGREHLVGYLVAGGEGAIDLDRLTSRLAGSLPAYMVPSRWRVLEAMPLTATGKLDRGALAASTRGPVPDPRPSATRSHARSFGAPAGAGRAATGGGSPVPLPGPRWPAARDLAGIWRRLLGHRPGPEDDFFRSGGDSLSAIELSGEARRSGWLLTPRQVIDNPRFGALAAIARPAAESPAAESPAGEGAAPLASAGPTAAAEAGEPLRLPFAPLQRYFFAQTPVPDRWTVARAFTAGAEVVPQYLEAAAQAVADRHDSLGLRFFHGPAGWRQEAGPPPRRSGFLHVDLTRVPHRRRSRVLAETAAGLHRDFDLTRGPLVRFCLIELGTGCRPLLLIVAHHLVADELSLAILRDDLEVAYGDLAAGRPLRLPPPTTPFSVWARRAVEVAGSPEAARFRRSWAALPWRRAAPLPTDFPGGRNLRGSVDGIRVRLDRRETAALLAAAPTLGATVEDLLLAALARGLGSWSPAGPLLVHRVWHGRDTGVAGIDLSRTVGCLGSLLPVLLDLDGAATPGAALQAVRRPMSHLPGGAAAATLLGYSADADGHHPILDAVPPPQVVLNYFGRRAGPPPRGPLRLRPAAEDGGPRHPPAQSRPYLLGVFAALEGGILDVRIDYSREMHRRRRIELLAGSVRRDLRHLGRG